MTNGGIMRRLAILLAASTALLPLSLTAARPQSPPPAPAQQAPFTFEKVMVPMHDGAKMETVILRPRGQTGPLPILFQRTPYGVPQGAPPTVPGGWKSLVDDGYIFVFQSMRGRFGSDGTFTLSTAVHPNDPTTVDEATDAYDSIDWLVKQVPDNNGKVGMWGVSYPGFAAAVALVNPHPAVKAASPQAAWIDYWQNDDLHRNGALRLSYVADWVYSLQQTKQSLEDFPYDSIDTYDSLLKIGTLEGLDRGYSRARFRWRRRCSTIPITTASIPTKIGRRHWAKRPSRRSTSRASGIRKIHGAPGRSTPDSSRTTPII